VRTRWLVLLGTIAIPFSLSIAISYGQASRNEALKKNEGLVIEGQVLRDSTGEPIRGARLMLMSATRNGAGDFVTERDGKFRFVGVLPGPYVLRAERDGFVSAFFHEPNEGGRARLFEITSTSRRGLEIRLEATAAIIGRIFDQEGEPKSGIFVSAVQAFKHGDRTYYYEVGGGGTTNDLGAYRLYGLQPGAYLVRAVPSDYQEQELLRKDRPHDGHGVERSWTTFYPGTTDRGQALPVGLGPGMDVKVDLTIQRTRLFMVRGRVELPTGTKSDGSTQLRLMSSVDEFEPGKYQIAAIDGPNGEFEIAGVLPGTYFLMAAVFHDGRSYRASEKVEVNGQDVDGVLLRPAAGSPLRGRIVSEEGISIAFARVRAGLGAKDYLLTGPGDFTDVKPDGSFTLQDLPDGEYFPAILGLEEGLYLETATASGKDVLKGMSISGGMAGDLHLTIGKAKGLVEGVVLDRANRPVFGAYVALKESMEQFREGISFQERITDAQGRFRFPAVPPAEFEIVAMEPGFMAFGPDANLDENEAQVLEQNRKKIVMKPGGAIQVELRIGKPRAQKP